MYFSKRQQKIKGNGTCSTYFSAIYDIPQASILCPLLFNIYIDNADNITLINTTFYLKKVIKKLEWSTTSFFRWLSGNWTKTNAGKCYLLVTKDANSTVNIGEFDIENSKEERLLEVDNKLSFHLAKTSPKVARSRRNSELYRNKEM